VKESPTSADAHGVLGATLVRAGQLDDATAELHEALAINPKLPHAHYNLGNVFLQQGDVAAAITNYESELELQPALPEVHNNLANALFRIGEPDKAMQHLQTALKLNPNYAEARNNLAIALSQKGKMPEAISEWNRTLAIEPNNLQAQCNLAWVLATSPSTSIRNGAVALQHAQRALLLSGEGNARIWRLVAAAEAELGRFDAAIDAAEKGLRLARDENDSALVQTLESNIAQFRNGSPLRDIR
jgi:tetratricopeptide (TPR) repeat protein